MQSSNSSSPPLPSRDRIVNYIKNAVGDPGPNLIYPFFLGPSTEAYSPPTSADASRVRVPGLHTHAARRGIPATPHPVFKLSFSDQTPRRLLLPRPIVTSLVLNFAHSAWYFIACCCLETGIESTYPVNETFRSVSRSIHPSSDDPSSNLGNKNSIVQTTHAGPRLRPRLCFCDIDKIMSAASYDTPIPGSVFPVRITVPAHKPCDSIKSGYLILQ